MSSKWKDYLEHCKRKLERSVTDENALIAIIGKLTKFPITVELLQETGILKIIEFLSKRNDEVGEKAMQIYNKWKIVADSKKVHKDSLSDTSNQVSLANQKYSHEDYNVARLSCNKPANDTKHISESDKNTAYMNKVDSHRNKSLVPPKSPPILSSSSKPNAHFNTKIDFNRPSASSAFNKEKGDSFPNLNPFYNLDHKNYPKKNESVNSDHNLNISHVSAVNVRDCIDSPTKGKILEPYSIEMKEGMFRVVKIKQEDNVPPYVLKVRQLYQKALMKNKKDSPYKIERDKSESGKGEFTEFDHLLKLERSPNFYSHDEDEDFHAGLTNTDDEQTGAIKYDSFLQVQSDSSTGEKGQKSNTLSSEFVEIRPDQKTNPTKSNLSLNDSEEKLESKSVEKLDIRLGEKRKKERNSDSPIPDIKLGEKRKKEKKLDSPIADIKIGEKRKKERSSGSPITGIKLGEKRKKERKSDSPIPDNKLGEKRKKERSSDSPKSDIKLGEKRKKESPLSENKMKHSKYSNSPKPEKVKCTKYLDSPKFENNMKPNKNSPKSENKIKPTKHSDSPKFDNKINPNINSPKADNKVKQCKYADSPKSENKIKHNKYSTSPKSENKVKHGKSLESPKSKNKPKDSQKLKKISEDNQLEPWSSVGDMLKVSGSPYKSCDKKSSDKMVLSDEAAMKYTSSKKERTSVYSGKRKIQDALSLRECCIQSLRKNVESLRYLNKVPYELLKPVLKSCSPVQLKRLEEHNNYLLKDTEELWKNLCVRKYRDHHPSENQTWRHLYWTLHDEQDRKLKNITANICASMSKARPERQIKLTVADSSLKRQSSPKQMKLLTHGEEKKVLKSESKGLKPALPVVNKKSSKKESEAPLMSKVKKYMGFVSKYKK